MKGKVRRSRASRRRVRRPRARTTNIRVAKIIAESVRSSFGPEGMYKLLVRGRAERTGEHELTVTSDGATFLKKLHVQHPVGSIIVDTANTTAKEVGDGTKSVVILVGQLLKNAEDLIKKGVHPTTITEGFTIASNETLRCLNKIAVPTSPLDRKLLKKICVTSMARASLQHKEHLAKVALEAILQVTQKVGESYRLDVNDVKIAKMEDARAKESLYDIDLIRGILLDRGRANPAMPRRVENARIALVTRALHIKRPWLYPRKGGEEEWYVKIDTRSPEEMEAFLDEDRRILKEMAEKVVNAGANVLIVKKGVRSIHELTQYYLAKNGVLAVRYISEDDIKRLSKATGAKVITSLDDLTSRDLGYAKLVEEKKIGGRESVLIEGCRNPKSVSILVRAGTRETLEETERSLKNALMAMRDVIRKPCVVAGGGAAELEVAIRLRESAMKIPGRKQLVMLKFAEALESIPMTLAKNAGLDPIDALLELKARHKRGEKWAGIGIIQGHGEIGDMTRLGVYEPLVVKQQVVRSATEASNMILRVEGPPLPSKASAPPRGGADRG